MGHDDHSPREVGNGEDEIRAAVAARQELGEEYDTSIAEGLVDRIGEQIDERVNARLRDGDSGRSGGSGYLPRVKGTVVVAGLSTVMGALLALAVWDTGPAGDGKVVAVVLAVLAVNIIYSLYRDLHVRGDDRLR